MKTGVLLINLGTPAAPEASAVRPYLKQFLTDERVIDIPALPRNLLVRGVIAPLRAPKSAAAYKTVWTDEGSPLLVFGMALLESMREALPELQVELAMRYGQPSIAAGLATLRAEGCDRVLLAPLYPQYASSSTGSSVAEAYRIAANQWNTPFLSVLPPFYDDPGFVRAFAAVGRPVLDDLGPDQVLFSFHGLPERHCTKSDESGGKHCFARPDCCDAIVEANRSCYRAQCFATARALREELNLPEARSPIAFQSRLGRDPWIRPYTDELIVELAKAGVKRLAVFCPAFVADCLETLEEIGDRADADFRAAGGERLELVPSLNAHPEWVMALADLIRRALPAEVAESLG
ncbi:ferrochelatase [Engelhardtia mirabilis]|uniref:Ferrochelatase n=1 Tax=Engelhardtia mirabilis TaxID=2528011 RepID=A0A518BQG0_9BACT|nr:Ferrochelatase [Planctomycetes bacterium Pla133]QDV03528.1 Ferrochelatase [Planctomycetes bacterium Pla86]